MSRITLLGVPIDAITNGQALERLQGMLASGKQHHVLTPNSEMLVAAHHDDAFKQVLRQGDLNLPDSQGIVTMGRYIGQYVPERVTGVDTVTALCSALTEADSVFLLGAAPGIAEQASLALLAKNPHLQIAGTYAGSPRDEDAQIIIEQINAVHPHILFVAYGAPEQDMWIARHLEQMPSVRIAMGVGGTFDFLAGIRKRAPNIFQALGMEWLWRLVLEPRRFPRIFTAVILFPILVLLHQSSDGEVQ